MFWTDASRLGHVRAVTLVVAVATMATAAAHAEPGPAEDPARAFIEYFDEYFTEHPELAGKSGTGFKPYMRAKWFLEQRMVDGQLPPSGARFDAWQRRSPSPQGRGTPYWFSLGPRNIGGRVLSMTFDPQDAQVIYAGTAGGGLWRSEDRAASWEPLTDDLPFLAVGGVAVNPLDSDQLMIATGQGQGGGIRIDGVGIWRSMDRGATWQETDVAFDRSTTNGFYFVKADPDDGRLFAGGRDALYTSSDWGTTWSVAFAGEITDLAFVPGQTWLLAFERNVGVHRSLDDGATWNLELSDPTAGRGRVTVSKLAPAHAYALVGHSDTQGLSGIYRTTDAGANWTTQNTTYDLTNGSQSFIHQALAIDPLDPDVVVVGGVNLMKSVDTAVSFTQINDGATQTPHVDYLGAIWDPDFPIVLWIWGDGGVWRSPDGGTTWVHVSEDLGNVQLYDVGLRPADPAVDVIFGGAQDNGIERRLSGLNDWELVNGGDGMITIVHSGDPINVFGTTQNGNHKRSTDGGDTFGSNNGNIGSASSPWVTPKVTDPNDPEFLITTTDEKLYRETNATTCGSGNCWSAVDSSGVAAASLAVSPADGNVIWALMEDGTMRKSTDRGVSFSQVAAAPAGVGEPTRVAAHPTDPLRAWTTFSGYGTGLHVFTTANGGTTWQNRTGNLPDIPVNTIAIPADLHAWYVGTDLGVYATGDGGATWIEYGQALPMAIVTDLEIHEPSGVLVASTLGRGAWSIVMANTVAVGEPDVTPSAPNLLLSAPAPNPTRATTRIRFAAHHRGEVTLDIMDVSGRLVERLTSVARGDGEVREILWDASGVAPGVYFATLTAGNDRVARKIAVSP